MLDKIQHHARGNAFSALITAKFTYEQDQTSLIFKAVQCYHLPMCCQILLHNTALALNYIFVFYNSTPSIPEMLLFECGQSPASSESLSSTDWFLAISLPFTTQFDLHIETHPRILTPILRIK